jgi:hypothetical protein
VTRGKSAGSALPSWGRPQILQDMAHCMQKARQCSGAAASTSGRPAAESWRAALQPSRPPSRLPRPPRAYTPVDALLEGTRVFHPPLVDMAPLLAGRAPPGAAIEQVCALGGPGGFCNSTRVRA